MSGFLCCLILAIALLPAFASAANVYYVSSQFGNDSWSGSLPSPNSSNSDGPFQSLGRAQAQMQLSSIKTVNLRAGTYSIAPGFKLSTKDNGETWAAYPGETPVLDGGSSGTIVLNNPSNVTFQGVTIQNLGSGGLFINYGHSINLQSNKFLNCNLNCISGNGVENSTISGNTLNGQTGNDAAIKLWFGSSNNQITHNLIENTAGGGINFLTGTTDPPANNNIVDRNIFQNIGTNAFDGGAVYMVDTSHSAVGNQITNNIVNGIGGTNFATNLTKSFYLDDLMSNVVISGNICRGCGQFAWQIHAGDHNTITNNIFDLSSGSLLGIYQTEPSNGTRGDYGMGSNTFQHNIVYFSGSAPSSLYQVNIVASDALPNDTANLYFSATNAHIPNGANIVDSDPVYSNPSFAQPSAGNYSMPSSSPAYSVIGFQPLATDQGPQGGASSSSTGNGSGLTGSGNSTATTANLTAEGPADWVHWGTLSLTRKRGVTAQIGNWSLVASGSANYYTNDPRAVTFTDGTSPTSATVTDGIYVNGQNGFAFTVPAGLSSHTLTVHVGGYASAGTFTAHLSDGSASNFVDTTQLVSGQYDRNYTLTYNAASNGQTLTIQWVRSSGNGNVTLDGAALQ